MDRRILLVSLVVLALLVSEGLGRSGAQVARQPDDRLAAAEEYVAGSDRYLHHDKLRRGMRGYGLTVLTGTEIVKFDAEVISVLTNMSPHQDVILARLSGQGLEQTRIISGMSGSPVYVRDPEDGKDKLIGAVAFSWSFQRQPLCGIQPITQMLAGSGLFDSAPESDDSAAASYAPSGAAPAAAAAQYLAAALNPRKIDFASLARAKSNSSARATPTAAPQLVPLSTPLMVSGSTAKTLSLLGDYFRPVGLVPVASGRASKAVIAEGAKLEPGAVVSIPLVTGDVDWYGAGTVTEVVGDRVLGFGHGLFAQGEIGLPMGTGYVHTVVSSMWTSFKVFSTLEITGVLDRDERVGVAGRIGERPKMIPMTVNIAWADQARTQQYNYNICRHRRLTAILAQFLVHESTWSWRQPPEHHTLRYSVEVDFGALGSYQVSNISAEMDAFEVASDAARPIWALQNNPFGPPVVPQKISLDVTIEARSRIAELVDFKLDGNVYRPGQIVTGKVALRPFRKPRELHDITFPLPKDLPEGKYTIVACDARGALTRQQQEAPHLFDPRSTSELFEALKLVVKNRTDRIYLRMPLQTGGIALQQRELPQLPDSKARMIREANIPRTHKFTDVLVRPVPAEYVISGSARASFTVKLRPTETLLH